MRHLRTLFSLVCVVYIVALILYLALRAAFGDSVWWLAFLNNFAPYYFVPLLGFLPLALLSRLNVRLSLAMLILVVVGALWFGTRFLPRSVARAEANPALKVITFNVWGDNPQLDDVRAWLRDQDADVVLLQEIPPVWSGVGIPELRDLYPHQQSQPADLRYWGQAILSRYPMDDAEDFDLADDGTGSHQRIVVDVNGQDIAVYNIHTGMPVRDEPRFHMPIPYFGAGLIARYDDTFRNAQIRALLERLQTETLPYIVGGDFNMSDNSVIYGEVAARMRDSFRECASGLGATWPLPERVGAPRIIPPLLRIDYLWHSDQFRTVNASTGARLGSDHLPVAATLEIFDKSNR